MNFQHNFFEETAKRYPEYIAVDDHGEKTTYRKLDQEANKLANFIRKLKIIPNNRVCILLEKNINQYISILGILKSGACWVPLSKNFPQERLKNIIFNVKPSLIITDKESLIKNSEIFSKINILTIDTKKIIDANIKYKENIFLKKDYIKESKIKPKNINNSYDLAYIIFTSGSTGLPKGVMISHQNTSEYLRNKSSYFKPKTKLRFAHISEITFDPSIFDIFVCWTNAGTVVPFNKNSYRISPYNFFLKNKKINVVFSLPSFMSKILDETDSHSSSCLKNLKHLIFTGEPIPKNLTNKIYKRFKDIQIYNAYGTTETSIISNWNFVNKRLGKEEYVPIGNVLPNIKYLLIDENGNPNANKGEICFSGEQISNGYWDNDYLNNKHFIRLSDNGKYFTKYYKTGDIVKKDNYGNLYLDGRVDNQVKINGYRIELEEIENNLNDLDDIKNIVALTYSKNQNKKLFFFIYADPKKNLKEVEINITNYIKNNFPFYMVPSNIYLLKKDFPRNINGKVDKNKLINDFIKND